MFLDESLALLLLFAFGTEINSVEAIGDEFSPMAATRLRVVMRHFARFFLFL